MPSVLAWVDYSHKHRDDMDRLLDAFRDESTVDELGIGTIRDTFSEMLFPGTSTLHTRARYLLFVSWLVSETASHRYPLERALQELRRSEVKLIGALLAGDRDGGVIGRDAQAALKRMPSVVYWSATRRYGLRRCDHGLQHHLRAVAGLPAATADEEDGVEVSRHDPDFRELPERPADLVDLATFQLSEDEATFLRERIMATCPGSYLAWLVEHRTPDEADHPWSGDLTEGLSPKPARVLGHAQRLHHLFHGAPLLYNLLLARERAWDEKVTFYEELLEGWAGSPDVRSAAEGWDENDFWQCVSEGRSRLNRLTQGFLTSWIDLVRTGPEAVNEQRAADLVRQREQRLKGARSRFTNRDALDAWRGDSGIGGLQYRWPNARTLVNDIRAPLEASGA